MSFDWDASAEPSASPQSTQDAQDYIRRLQEIWKDTQKDIERAQERQRTQANKHRREVDFGVGDLVSVTTRNWKLDRPSRKLSDQSSGPYKILAKEGYTYRLELPDSIKVHPVFSPDKLRRAAKSAPLTGQIADPALPMEVNDQQEWEVDEIVDVRLHYRKLQYKAKWIGIEHDDDWYPAGDFKNAPEKLMAFHKRYPELPGPPARLSVWLDAALNDYFMDDHPDDGKPEPRGEPL
jgi:hypothetical protein